MHRIKEPDKWNFKIFLQVPYSISTSLDIIFSPSGPDISVYIWVPLWSFIN